ncbi:MAG: hypothetical protein JTT11_05920 [Candidatus Brockarchaeota archaeon]|nr:hypothetical protein [Candidatus Brockarchaeota archaeon]
MLQDLPFTTVIGLLIAAVGIMLAVLPYLLRWTPSIRLEKVHPLLIWVYRRGDLVVATSPLLILATLAIAILKVLLK